MKNIWKIIISSAVVLVLLCGVVVLSTQADEEEERVGVVGLAYLPIESTSYSQFFTGATLADVLEHDLVNTLFSEFPEFDFRDDDIDYSVLKLDGFSIGDDESVLIVFDIESEDNAGWIDNFIDSLADMFMFEVEELEGDFWVVQIDYSISATIHTSDNKLFVGVGVDSSLLENCLAVKGGEHESFTSDPDWTEIERIMGGTPGCSFNRFEIDEETLLTIASSSRSEEGMEFADIELVGGVDSLRVLIPEEYMGLFDTFIENQSDISNAINSMPDALVKMAISSLYSTDWGLEIPYNNSDYNIRSGSTAYSLDIDFLSFIPKTNLGWFGSAEDMNYFLDKYFPEDEVEFEEIEDEQGIFSISAKDIKRLCCGLRNIYDYAKLSDESAIFSEDIETLKVEPEIEFPLNGEAILAAYIDLNSTIDKIYDMVLVMFPTNDEQGMLTLKECLRMLSDMDLSSSARLYIDGDALKMEVRVTY